jgi:hypothetical protein
MLDLTGLATRKMLAKASPLTERGSLKTQLAANPLQA